MRVECIHCRKQYSLRDENAGMHFKCRSCGKISPVTALSAAAIDGTATDHALIDTAGQRTTADPAVVCPACGKRHRLSPNLAAARYRCSACGASMPTGRPDARSASADQVVWAEVLSAPGTALALANELATPSRTDDLFAEIPPPTSSHVISSAAALDVWPSHPQPSSASIAATCEHCGEKHALPQAAAGKNFRCKRCGAMSPVPSVRPAQVAMAAVVDENDSSYRLAPATVEGAPSQRAAPAKPASRRAASKKRNRSRSATDLRPFLRTIGGAAAIIIGAAIIVGGVYVILYPEGHHVRRPIRAIVVGVGILGVGFRLITGGEGWHDTN